MRRAGAIGVLVASLAVAGSARAQDPAAQPDPKPAAGAPAAGAAPVHLDQLLTLPSNRQYSVERKGGLTRGEWRARYGEVRTDLQKEREAYEQTQSKLEDEAGGQWSVNPIPGSDQDATKNPVDFQLRTQLRRHRDEIDRLERKIRQLDIEANLAGVPDEWRH
jgi:hypothetical protein